MKKLLLLWLLMLMSSISAFASETIHTMQIGVDYNEKGISSYTSSFKVYENTSKQGNFWTVAGFNNNNHQSGWTDLAKCFRKGQSGTQSATVTSGFSMAKPVTEVAITGLRGTNNVKGKVIIKASLDESFTSSTELANVELQDKFSTSEGTALFTLNNKIENLYYQIEFQGESSTITSNGAFTLYSIEFRAEKEPTYEEFSPSAFNGFDMYEGQTDFAIDLTDGGEITTPPLSYL